MKAASIIKWGVVILISGAVHTLLFAMMTPAPAEKLAVDIVEIDLDMLQDTATSDPNPSLAELERQRLEEEQKRAEEKQRLEEERQKEEERLREEERIEAEKQQKLEQKRQEQLDKQREEQKRLDALAWEKKQAAKEKAAEASKKTLAANKASKLLAAKKTKANAAARAKAEAAKKAKAAAANKAAQAKRKVSSASVKSSSKPSYPRSLERKKITGQVKVKIQISSSGKVTSASIYKSSGHAAFDQSALKAAKRWRFNPAKNGLGQAISDTKILPFVFKF